VTEHRNGGEAHTDAMKPTVTSWEIGAMTVLSVLALAAGVWIAAANVNRSLSAKSVGGSIMPRGMIMRPDQPGASMKDMSAVDAGAVNVHGTSRCARRSRAQTAYRKWRESLCA